MLFPFGKHKYLRDFNALVNIIDSVQHGKQVYSSDTYQLALFKKLLAIPRRNNALLSLEDIRQQLLLIWWEVISRRKTERQSLRAYLLRLSVLELTYWYQKQMRVPDRDESLSQATRVEVSQRIPWLIENKDKISDFQAYLLFLRFIQDLTIIEITKVLQRDKRTVRALMYQTLQALKE